MTETNAERLEVMKNIRFRIVEDGNVRLDRDSFDYLIEQAERAQELEKENQLLYGRLNMISDIIEEGRNEAKKMGENTNG